jgi:hypothetical protein
MKYPVVPFALFAAWLAGAVAYAQTPTTPQTDQEFELQLRNAPSVEFNGTNVFEPLTVERVSLDLPRNGAAIVTFEQRFAVTRGSASKNIEVTYSFSSITFRHHGSQPGTAKITLRTADGRAIVVSAQSINKRGEDHYVFVR